MMDKVEMSLEDIINNSQEEFRRGGGVFRRSASGGVRKIRSRPAILRSGSGFGAGRTQFSRSPGDINSRFSGGPTKLVVSNLDHGLSNSDIQELFKEFGPLKSANVNYDKSGRSLGSANIVFERRSDAVKAMQHFNTAPHDRRLMHIELTTSDVGAVLNRTSLGGGFVRGGDSRGMSRGGGGGRFVRFFRGGDGRGSSRGMARGGGGGRLVRFFRGGDVRGSSRGMARGGGGGRFVRFFRGGDGRGSIRGMARGGGYGGAYPAAGARGAAAPVAAASNYSQPPPATSWGAGQQGYGGAAPDAYSAHGEPAKGFRRGGGRGRGARGGRNRPTPTAAELDAQLDAYHNQKK